MAFEDTQAAIGAVGELLRAQLGTRTTAGSIEVGRPEEAASGTVTKLNLFLYQVDVDGNLRDRSIDAGQPPALWLILRYLLTAYDNGNSSNSTDAHGLLGEGMLALQELNFLKPGSAPLMDNPEPLKISFDEADAELISKLMQNNSDTYRVSSAFQIRPIMIAPSKLPRYAPLVKTVGPPQDEGVVVIPGIGHHLSTLEPEYFEPGATLTFTGTGLSSAIEDICFGDTCYPVTAAPAGKLLTVVPSDTPLSAGAYPITAVRQTSSGHRMQSNAVLGHLLPVLVNVNHGILTTGLTGLSGDLMLTGSHIGNADDSIFVAFFRQGEVVLMLEATGIATQDALTVTVLPENALPVGYYRIILRVNGEQAINSPEIDWS